MAIALVKAPENASDPADFDTFWLVYPRREAKKEAKKHWDRMTPKDRFDAIVAAVEWRKVWRAQQRDIRMVPLPSTWLFGERWTDEVPSEYTAASHVPAKLPEAGERSVMPQSVRDAIARLRK